VTELQLANSSQENGGIPSGLLLGSGTQGKSAARVERTIGSEDGRRDTPGTGPCKTALKRKARSRRRVQVVTYSVLNIDPGRDTVLSSGQARRDRDKHSSLEEHIEEGRLIE